MVEFRSYKKRKSYGLVLFVVLLAVSLSVASPYYIRYFFGAVVYPFQYTAVLLWKGVTLLPSFFVNLRHLSKDNAEMRERIKFLSAQQLLLEELKGENGRLRNILSFSQKKQEIALLAAQVIGRSPSPWFSIIEINKGARSGIKIDMPVVAKEGVVGRVVELSLFSSKAMLLYDAESSVAAVDSRSRDFGVVEGRFPDKLFMKYVSAGGDIKIGDTIKTSPVSTVFPSGLLIGTVSQADKREHDLFYYIEIKPAVDFSKLEEVFVII